MNTLEMNLYTGTPEYDKDFWNAMRGMAGCVDKIHKGRNSDTDSYRLPSHAGNKLGKAIEGESLFRQIGTSFKSYHTGYHIYTKDCDDIAAFVPEGGQIPIYDGMQDFSTLPVDSWKLATFLKFDEDFLRDASFDIESYLTRRLAKNFGRAETNAFINGTGVEMPTGILNATGGADVALTATTLTYDDIISLYFSVKPEYRSKGVWLMNDKTAMALRKLKDADGNYLWNQSNDTILGRQVIISEFMPDAQSEKKPVAFGDFSYYWVIDRRPVSARPILEKFSLYGQIGYLAYEFLDGKLIRPEAVKVIEMK